jgi:ankyrin repeat protein
MIRVRGLTLDNSFMRDAAYTRELLSRGADPNRTGPRGIPILVGAIVSSEDTSCVEVLLEYGAKLEPEFLFDALRPRVRQIIGLEDLDTLQEET